MTDPVKNMEEFYCAAEDVEDVGEDLIDSFSFNANSGSGVGLGGDQGGDTFDQFFAQFNGLPSPHQAAKTRAWKLSDIGQEIANETGVFKGVTTDISFPQPTGTVVLRFFQGRLMAVDFIPLDEQQQQKKYEPGAGMNDFLRYRAPR